MGVLGEGTAGSWGPGLSGAGVRVGGVYGHDAAPTAELIHGFGQNRFRKTSTVMSNDVQDCSCRVLTVQRARSKTVCAAQSYFRKKVISCAFRKARKETH